MGNVVTVERGGAVEVYDDVLMHRVGDGVVQIVERNGCQSIIKDFEAIRVDLDEEGSAKFNEDLIQQEALIAAQEADKDALEPDLTGSANDEAPALSVVGDEPDPAA